MRRYDTHKDLSNIISSRYKGSSRVPGTLSWLAQVYNRPITKCLGGDYRETKELIRAMVCCSLLPCTSYHVWS